MGFKSIWTILLLTLLVSCGDKKDTSDCDPGSSEGLFGDTSYDCPTGDPSSNSIYLSQSSYNMGEIEAGTTKVQSLFIENRSDSKVFDFSIEVPSNFNVTYLDCPTKLQPSQSCSLQVSTGSEIAGDIEGTFKFTERTGKVKKDVRVHGKIVASYPVDQEITSTTQIINYKTTRVNIGPLFDRFGNVINAPFKVLSNRGVSEFNGAYNSSLDTSSNGGIFSFYVQTNQLETGSIQTDISQVDILLEKDYLDFQNIYKQLNLVFLSNKPLASNLYVSEDVDEDSVYNLLPALPQGSDSQGRALSYQIENLPAFGVLSDCLEGDTFLSLSSCKYTPSPNFYGTDSFSYKVYNGEALSFNSTTIHLNVAATADAPILLGGQIILALEDQSATFSLKPAQDPDGDENLIYQIVSPPSLGELVCSNINCVYTPTANYQGTQTFSYKVIDSSSLESETQVVQIQVENKNDAPILGGSESITITEDQLSSFTLTAATDIDPGDNLIYKITSEPTKGVLSNCLNGDNDLSCEYLGNLDNTDQDQFAYVAQDSSGALSEERIVQINFIPVNDAPKFAGEFQDERVNINGVVSFSLDTAIDPENQAVTYELLTMPAQGLLSNCLQANQNLNCQYSPPSNFSGQVSFNYRARDIENSFSQTRTVRIQVNISNSNPTLMGSGLFNTQEDTELVINLTPGDDLESPGSLNYRIGNTVPSLGILKGCLNLEGSSGQDDLSCVFTPNLNVSGTDSFSYFVTDPHGGSSQESLISINILAVNDPPKFVNEEQGADVVAGQSVSMTLEPALDPEGNNPISYSLKPEDLPEKGVLSPECMSQIGIINNCRYTANVEAEGLDDFIYYAIDSLGNRSEHRVYINITSLNKAPTIAPMNGVIDVNEDTLVSISLNDAVDLNEDLITYELVSSPSHGLLSGCLGINSVQGNICSYHPYSNYSGEDEFSFRAFDGQSYSNVVVVELNILPLNDAPFFANIISKELVVEAGDSISFEIMTAQDIDEDPISYQIVSQPSRGVISDCFSGSPLSCVYTANGNDFGEDIFVYEAFDGQVSSFNRIEISINVLEPQLNRVYPLDVAGNPIYLNNDPTVEKEVISVGDSLYFNAASTNSNYAVNNLYHRSVSGVVSLVGSPLLSGKYFKYKDNLYVIDESDVSFNKLKIYNNFGFSREVNYAKSIELENPVEYQGQIYFGSSQSKLFKFIFLKIQNSDYSFIKEVLSFSDFGINGISNKVIPLRSFRGKLYLSFRDDSGGIKIARINERHEQEILGGSGSSSSFENIDNLIFFDRQESSKIYLMGQRAGGRKLWYLNTEDPQSYQEVSTNQGSQSALVEGKMFSPLQGSPSIIYRNTDDQKLYSLDPDSSILNRVEGSTSLRHMVSNDGQRLINITSGNVVQYTDSPVIPSSNFKNITGFLGDWAASLERSSFVVKQHLSNTMWIVDDNGEFSLMNTYPGYIAVENFYENNQGFFSLASKNIGGNVLFEHIRYNPTSRYYIFGNRSNVVEGLIPGSFSATYSLFESPSYGILDNCLSLGTASNNDLSCLYTGSGEFQEDRFAYTITEQSLDTDISVKLENINKQPIFEQNNELETFATFSDIGEVFEYVVVEDELFMIVEQEEILKLVRYTKAEGLQYIISADIESLRVRNREVYFVQKGSADSLRKYNPITKVINTIFVDSFPGSSLDIVDYIFSKDDANALMIAKDLGASSSERLIKLSLSNFSFEEFPINSQIQEGLLFFAGETLYAEVSDGLMKFDPVEEEFVRSLFLPETQSVYKGSAKASSEFEISMLLVTEAFSAEIRSFAIFNPEEEELQTFTDPDNSSFLISSYITERMDLSSDFISYYQNNSGDSSFSRIEFIRTLTSSNRQILEFNGNYLFNENISRQEGNVFFISRNSDWSEVEFYKYGATTKYYVKNQSTTSVKLPSFKDPEGYPLNYELVDSPIRGVLSDCLGMDASSSDDLDCNYTHTDNMSSAVIDNFSIRAFDGDKYSEDKIISLNIRNNSPQFSSSDPMDVIAISNEVNLIALEEATDAEGNEIHYIITQDVTNGSLSGCIKDVQDIGSSTNICSYTPSNNYIGPDVFKYRAFDGLGYSVEKIVNIDVQESPEPIFITSSQKNYMNKSQSSLILTIEKALDPNLAPLNYSIVDQPDSGVLSNCFVLESQNLKCTYTPNDLNFRGLDSFSYKASNGTFESEPRIVNIYVTNSLITGSLGHLVLTSDGPTLLKNGQNNISSLSSLVGYEWDSVLKVLTLRANKSYHFESILVEDGVSLEFKGFDDFGAETSTHGWTKVYSQGGCILDGNIYSRDFFTQGLSSYNISDVDVDGELLSYTIPQYLQGSFGGRKGADSNEALITGNYGLPTAFKGANGEQTSAQDFPEAIGGAKGKDGGGLLIKCVESIAGNGVINVSGRDGKSGADGVDGSNNGIVSFGGAGGAGGGNGGHGGAIILRTMSNTFQGDLLYSNGAGGSFGLGGLADPVYTTPNSAQDGNNGEAGVAGSLGECFSAPLDLSLTSCF